MTAWTKRYTLLILLLITVVGACYRLFQINILPPGDGYDAAYYGLDALRILDGERPIFFATNFGREALLSYLVAFLYLFSDPGPLGVHLSSALVGIVTIPAVFLAARELLSEETEFIKVWTPLLAALVMAISYWHLNYSRLGLRVILVPLFGSLIAAALWRGLRSESRKAFAAAGFMLGLSLYTYPSARLLPLLVLVGFALTYLHRRSFKRHDLVDMFLTFGIAFIFLIPLALVAVDQPHAVSTRSIQTVVFFQEDTTKDMLAAFGDQALVTLRTFFIEGENMAIYSLPGRPSLNTFLGAAFLAGIGFALYGWKKPSVLFLLAWLLLLTAPGMIADQGVTAKRALGALPAVIILIAYGLTMVYTIVNGSRFRTLRLLAPVYAIFVALGLVLSGFSTYNDYFVRWGQDPGLGTHFQRDHFEIGLAAGRIPRDESILISPFSVTHPSIQLNSLRHPDMRSYDGHACFVIPASQDHGLTYLITPGETERSLEQLVEVYPQGWISSGPDRPDMDDPYYYAYHVPPGAEPKIGIKNGYILNWDDKIKLLDFSVSPKEAQPGETVTISMSYEALQDLDKDYTAYIHLLSQEEGTPPLAQADSEPCRRAFHTRAWRAGDIVRDTIELPIAEWTPPGTYRLTSGFYTWPEITALPLKDPDLNLLTNIEIR